MQRKAKFKRGRDQLRSKQKKCHREKKNWAVPREGEEAVHTTRAGEMIPEDAKWVRALEVHVEGWVDVHAGGWAPR